MVKDGCVDKDIAQPLAMLLLGRLLGHIPPEFHKKSSPYIVASNGSVRTFIRLQHTWCAAT